MTGSCARVRARRTRRAAPTSTSSPSRRALQSTFEWPSPLAPQPGASRRRASGAKAEARRHGKRTASERARAHAHFDGHTTTPISNPSLVKRRALLQSCSKSLTWGELPNLELSLPRKAQTTLTPLSRKTHTAYPPNTAQPTPTPYHTRYCTPHQNPCSSLKRRPHSQIFHT